MLGRLSPDESPENNYADDVSAHAPQPLPSSYMTCSTLTCVPRCEQSPYPLDGGDAMFEAEPTVYLLTYCMHRFQQQGSE